MKNLNKIKIAPDMQYEIGQDKVGYFPEWSVKDDSTLYEKVRKLAHSTFDRSKFTVVGSPNITDGGIASGFLASDNYISIGTLSQHISGNKWKIRFKLFIPATGDFAFMGISSDATTSRKSFQLAVYQNSLWAYLGDGTIGQSFGNNGVVRNSNMFFEIRRDGTKYYTELFDENNNSLSLRDSDVQYDVNLSSISYIGGGLGTQLFTGSIDLKQFSITVDGEEVFNGLRQGIDVLKPNNFTTVTTIYAYKFGDNTVYSNVTNNTNPTELYNSDGSYYLDTDFQILNDKVTYPEQATRGADDITIEGVTYYEFEHTTGGSSTNIYADDPTTPTALFNSDGSEYTGTQWNIMSSKVYYLNDATYTSSANITINRDYNTVDAGVKISEDGIVNGFNGSKFLVSPVINNLGTSPFKIITKFKYIPSSSQVAVYQIRNSGWANYLLITPAGELKLYLSVGTSETAVYSYNGPRLVTGEDYTHIFEFTGSQYTFKLYQNEQLIDSKSFSSSSPVYPSTANGVYIGHSSFGGNFTSGSIDLNAFKIFVDGDLVYQPCLKIPYTEGQNYVKIVDKLYRDRVKDLFEQKGYNGYYTIGEDDFTLPSNKWSDIVEHKENGLTVAEQRVDQTLTIRGTCEQGVDVNLPMEFFSDDSYAVFGVGTTGTNTASKFTPAADGNYIAIGKGKV